MTYEQSQIKLQCIGLSLDFAKTDKYSSLRSPDEILGKAKEIYEWVTEGRDFQKEQEQLLAFRSTGVATQ